MGADRIPDRDRDDLALLPDRQRPAPSAATRVGIIAMLEPVGATIVAWAWLNESLGALQLVGAAIVLAGIVLAQTAR
jgi:EamA-like transporter family